MNFCKAAYLRAYDGPEEKKADLQEKYRAIAKYELEQQIEVHGEKEFEKDMWVKYNNISMQLVKYDAKAIGGSGIWVEETEPLFNDE